MINLASLYRTFLIRFRNGIGSAFAIDVEGKQYLITAKHVVFGINDGDQIKIFFHNKMNSVRVRVAKCDPDGADIIVLALPSLVAKGDQPEPDPGGIILSQDVFFLGFPFAWRPNLKMPDNSPFPLPFVKKGALAAMDFTQDLGSILYIDGQSNAGFSGGPVIFKEEGSGRLKIAGVIHGSVATVEPVTDKGGATGLNIESDAGLIQAFGLKPALDAIARNPIGFPLPRNG